MRVNMEETKLIVTGPCLDILRDWCISMCCLSERCWSGERNQVLAVQTLGAWEVSRAEWLQTQTMFAQGVLDKLVQLMAEQ